MRIVESKARLVHNYNVIVAIGRSTHCNIRRFVDVRVGLVRRELVSRTVVETARLLQQRLVRDGHVGRALLEHRRRYDGTHHTTFTHDAVTGMSTAVTVIMQWSTWLALAKRIHDHYRNTVKNNQACIRAPVGRCPRTTLAEQLSKNFFGIG